jgi:hypothetical protein
LEQLLRDLVAALNAADLYLNSYDTSAPSRIKAETRAAVEAAIGLAHMSRPPVLELATPGCDRCGALPGTRHDRDCLRPLLPKRDPTLSEHPEACDPRLCNQCAEAQYLGGL